LLHKAFQLGFSENGGICIDMLVSHPDHKNEGDKFWESEWMNNYLEVDEWEIFSGTQNAHDKM